MHKNIFRIQIFKEIFLQYLFIQMCKTPQENIKFMSIRIDLKEKILFHCWVVQMFYDHKDKATVFCLHNLHRVLS